MIPALKFESAGVGNETESQNIREHVIYIILCRRKMSEEVE
jgi:hypothetical protein